SLWAMSPDPAREGFSPETRQTLIASAADGGVTTQLNAQNQLVAIYRPVLRHLAAKFSVHQSEVDDVVQEFLIKKFWKLNLPKLFASHRHHYTASRFRKLLVVTFRRFVIDYHRRSTRIRDRSTNGNTMIGEGVSSAVNTLELTEAELL